MVERYSHTEATGGKKPRTEERSRLKDLPTAPGYEWLHEMDKRDDIIRIYVDERHDTMYMHQEGMSAVAKIVVSIIMSCISGGTLSILTAIMTNLTINTIEARGDPVEGTKRTLSKEGLKSIGRSYVGQLLLDGDWGVAEGATWVATLQSAFMESLNTTLSDYLGRGIIDGDWRVNARRIGLDLVTSTAARFGAKQIGGWRKGTILGGGFMDYISHKIMHGALAAATSAATARLDHVKGAYRRKRIMGAASGAMMAEAVSEYMMNGALATVEAKLNASGHAPTSQAYADLRTKLMSDELRQIKMFAQLTVAASAEAMRFDLNAAMFAANNALENNFSQVFTALAFGNARADEVDDEADQQAYGKARKKVIDKVTPELAKKYGQAAAEYAYHLSLGPDGYAEAMLEAQTGGRKLAPEVRQVLLDAHSEHYFEMLHAFNVMQGMGAIGDALGSGAEYALRKAGLDRATARNIHRAINDGLTVTGVAGLAKSAAQFGARGASSSAKAATRTSLDGLGLEGRASLASEMFNLRPLESQHYSTIFRTSLSEGIHYPGKADRIHFQAANKQLYNAMLSDSGLAISMEKNFPGLTEFLKPTARGIFPDKPPVSFGLTWHHNSYINGVMELIPRSHHRSPGNVQANLHPGGKGGMSKWGGGRKK